MRETSLYRTMDKLSFYYYICRFCYIKLSVSENFKYNEQQIYSIYKKYYGVRKNMLAKGYKIVRYLDHKTIKQVEGLVEVHSDLICVYDPNDRSLEIDIFKENVLTIESVPYAKRKTTC